VTEALRLVQFSLILYLGLDIDRKARGGASNFLLELFDFDRPWECGRCELCLLETMPNLAQVALLFAAP